MSKVLKKIVRGVKKVFRKVVKVVKKIVKADIFKVAIAAAAIYFTAGATAGMLKGGATAGAGSGSAQALAPIVANTKGLAAAAPNLSAAAKASSSPITGILSKVSAAGEKVGEIAAAHPQATSAVLQTGGAMVSTYANIKVMDEERRLRERNSETPLNVYGNYQGSPLQYAAENRPRYATDRVENTDRKQPMAYNSSSNSWEPVRDSENTQEGVSRPSSPLG